MSIRCFVFGCAWEAGVVCQLGGEKIIFQYCKRCRSHRYVSNP